MAATPEPMNLYGLIASIVQSVASLAWPAAFAFAVWIFRRKLVELLPFFRLKHKDWEVSFKLERAEKEAAELPKPDAEVRVAVPTPEEQKRFLELAEISPQAAIVEVRRELEQALWEAASRARVLEAKRTSMLTLTRVLRDIGAIDKHTSALLDELRNLGNSAVHYSTSNFTVSDAIKYRNLADQAIERLNAIQG
jgi:Domain of unknown function (DUF4145)